MPAKSKSTQPSAPAPWAQVLSACLETLEREQAGSPCPIVDHEIVPGAPGSPDDFRVWFICRNRSEQARFRDTEWPRATAALTKKMVAAGFPESATASLTTRVTSRDEIAERGGTSNLYR